MCDHEPHPVRADGGVSADADEASEQLAAVERPDTSPDHYTFGELPLEPVRPGTAVLVVSPAAVNDASHGMLAVGNPGEGIVGVAARTSPRRFLHSLSEHTDSPLVEPHIGVVGCMNSRTPRIHSFPEAHVRTVSSPADLTGLGMRFSDLQNVVLDTIEERTQNSTRVRACLDSLTVLDQYVESRTLYRFLNAFNGRTRAADMLGIVTANRNAHDEREIGRFAGLFDGIVEIRETDSGLECRVRGLSGQPRGWRPFPTR